MSIDPQLMGAVTSAVAGTGNMMVGGQWYYDICEPFPPLAAGTWLIFHQAEHVSPGTEITISGISAFDYFVATGPLFTMLTTAVDGALVSSPTSNLVAWRLGTPTDLLAWDCQES